MLLSSKPFGERFRLSDEEIGSIAYHNIFDFPLTQSELIRWTLNPKVKLNVSSTCVVRRGGCLFVRGRGGLLYKKLLREKTSKTKMVVAKKAADIMALLPGIKFVGVTGALAMNSASGESDIDLVVITKKGMLWSSRLVVYGLLRLAAFPVRRPQDKNQKDKLCLNMWLDETNLVWRSPRNVFTAHEIAQIVPLVNKDRTYEKFLWKNKWIKDFWPNAVALKHELRITNDGQQRRGLVYHSQFILQPIEKLAFRIQYGHMKSRITCEVITPTRALFHPVDWGKYVLGQLALDKRRIG